MGKYRYRPLFFSDMAQLERPVGTQCDNLRSVVETLLVSGKQAKELVLYV